MSRKRRELDEGRTTTVDIFAVLPRKQTAMQRSSDHVRTLFYGAEQSQPHAENVV